MSGSLIKNILAFFSGFKTAPQAQEDLDRLQAEFKNRYQAFKVLLSANNKALEVMAKLDESLSGKRIIGRTFLKSRCTEASVSVLQMVRQLEILAPDKYPELEIKFREIESRLREILSDNDSEGEVPLVLDLKDIRSIDPLITGGKAANLAKLASELKFKIPSGFTVTSAAFDLFMNQGGLRTEIDNLLLYLHKDIYEHMAEVQPKIERLIAEAYIPEEITSAITQQIQEMLNLHPGLTFAARSSAIGEDSIMSSFAGQFESKLFVKAEDAVDAYRSVITSKYSARALHYASSRGVPDEATTMCVCFLEMIDSVSGGVIYTSNPANQDRESIIIDSTHGLAKAVVDGSEGVDQFIISRKASPLLIKEKRIASKKNGISINDEQALSLATAALEIEKHFGRPQDIEWTIDRAGQIIFLQARPLNFSGHGCSTKHIEIETEPLLLGGVTASSGSAGGPVHIMRSKATTLNVPEGCILVVTRAFPRYAPLLSRVAGLISEKGGLAGHLANVAREYGIPAIMGMEGATDHMASGDMVTMNADRTAVYPGIIEKLLKNSRSRSTPPVDTPLIEKMKAASKLITPLNLTDPESRDFSAAGCKTLHDLTRFIHEVSVKHMFRMGSSERSALRTAKQIVADRPLQWWVVNLDNGFATDIKGDYVGLAQIRCEPMTALWDGMMAVPWAGPPPVNARGFMSILVEASANPHLDPAVESPYNFKNYFMISRNFCLLHTRFGFHFSIAEALISDNPAENYVSFKFRGGAADYDRKRRRVEFIKSVLSYYGFRTRLSGENCFSRLTGQEKSYMLRALRALGYIIIHTRQMDMVMCDHECVSGYREQFIRDIDEIVSKGQDDPGFGDFFLDRKEDSSD